jgi:hypothetical protein
MATNIYQENPEFILGEEEFGGFISFQKEHYDRVVINVEFATEKTGLNKQDWIALKAFLDDIFNEKNKE